MTGRRVLILGGIGIVLALLQSTIDFTPVVPDIAMLLLVAAAWRHDSLSGEIAGFLIGLGFDAISLSPLGFHAFLYTLIGYAFGHFHSGAVSGKIIFPAFLALAATAIKYLCAFLLALVFGLNPGYGRYFSINTVWEAVGNMVLAPLVFFLLSFINRVVDKRRGGFR